MRRLLMYFCSAMCWVCIIGAGVTWGVKAAATVALALLLMAVVAAVIVVEYKEEVEAEIGMALEAVQAFIRDKEGDGNAE